jgi:hypothetical protein
VKVLSHWLSGQSLSPGLARNSDSVVILPAQLLDLRFGFRLDAANVIASIRLGAHNLVELQMQAAESRFCVFCSTNTIKSVRTEIETFVRSRPTTNMLIATRTPAIRNAQWLPVHFATPFEKALKKRTSSSLVERIDRAIVRSWYRDFVTLSTA